MSKSLQIHLFLRLIRRNIIVLVGVDIVVVEVVRRKNRCRWRSR